MRVHIKCGKKATKNATNGGDYPYQCLYCDESLYTFETEIRKNKKQKKQRRTR